MSSSSSSAVWNFFKKSNKDYVTCNLCGKNYKTSGNTTNLAAHLRNKHYHAYAEFKNAGSSNNSNSNLEPKTKKPAMEQKRKLPFSRTSSPIPSTSSSSSYIAHDAETANIVDFSATSSENYDAQSSTSVINSQCKQMTTQPTLMDILERSSSYEAGGQKTSEINQALIYRICKDNMPLSCVEKSGLKKFTHVICPRYKLPSRAKITSLVEQRYITTKAILKKKLSETANIALTSDILTLTNSTRSFLVMTAHFLNTTDDFTPESVTLTAQRMYQAHTADYIRECFEDIIKEFSIEKKSIHSMTTDGGSNIVSAVKKFLGDNKRIPCVVFDRYLTLDS